MATSDQDRRELVDRLAESFIDDVHGLGTWAGLPEGMWRDVGRKHGERTATVVLKWMDDRDARIVQTLEAHVRTATNNANTLAGMGNDARAEVCRGVASGYQQAAGYLRPPDISEED